MEYKKSGRYNWEEDNINKPSYYANGREYEPIDVIADWKLDFDLGNVVKYISRAGRKRSYKELSWQENEINDLRKARVYLEHAISSRMVKYYTSGIEPPEEFDDDEDVKQPQEFEEDSVKELRVPNGDIQEVINALYSNTE